MSDDETPAERVSRFREHTNTNSSIRPPPAELWKDVGIDGLLDKFSDENEQTPAAPRRPNHPRRIMEPTGHRKSPSAARAAGSAPNARKQSDAAATIATAEGTFGRFSRAFANVASVFGGVLGKRKAGHDAPETPVDPAQAALDERKRAAEEAYHLAKEQGLLPAPKVFVRPGMLPRAWSAGTSSIHSRSSIRVVDRDGDEADAPRWSSERSHSLRSARWLPDTPPAPDPANTRKRRKISVEERPQ